MQLVVICHARPERVEVAEGHEIWRTLVNDPLSLYPGDPAEWMDQVQRGFEQLVADHGGRTVAALSHGMVTSVLLHRWLGTDQVISLRPEYASLTWVQASADHGACTVRSVNETQHLGELRLEPG